MSKYSIHNDFKKYEYAKISLNPLLLPVLNKLTTLGFNRIKLAEGLTETKKTVPGYQKGNIDLTIYEPKEIGKNAPCLIYFHGGAFVLKAAPSHKTLVGEYALKTPCKVILVDYRLAPKYPFPVGFQDCYLALEWVSKNAKDIGVNPHKIAIGGDSAGGALAAAVSLMARDQKAANICFQMLIYPVTDARQITQSIKTYHDTPLWNSVLNEKMWQLYLKEGVVEEREYASPMEAKSLENLPNTYIEVAEFDCLRDEGVNFAESLHRWGNHVELHETTGTIHGFDIAENSEVVRLCVQRRIEALKTAFHIPSPKSRPLQ